jgi:hypothetical protein
MRRLLIVLGAVLVVLLVAGGSFYGGMAFQRSRQASVQEQFFAQRGFGPGGQAPLSGTPEGGFGSFAFGNGAGGAGGEGRGASGSIESLDGNTLTLSTPQGNTTVLLTDQTVINQVVRGSPSDLQTGERITAIGERDASGTLTATTIQILPESP